MTNHTVILINGRPRTGKDTVVNLMCNALMERGYVAEAFSSIDPIKALLGAVVDLSQKTEADRILLSEVGDALEKHCAFRTNRCIWFAEDVFRASENAVVFLHVREPENIEKLRDTFQARGINVVRMLVVSDRGIDVDSRADQVVVTGKYDWTIKNNGTLEDLKASCLDALSEMMLFARGGTVKLNNALLIGEPKTGYTYRFIYEGTPLRFLETDEVVSDPNVITCQESLAPDQ